MYSALEQHRDGSWWYHGRTFYNLTNAKEYLDATFWWDEERPQVIIEHEEELPRMTLWTGDCKTFKQVADSTPFITINSKIIYKKNTK